TFKLPLDAHQLIGFSADVGSFSPAGKPTFARAVAGVEHRYTARRLATKMEALGGLEQGAGIWGGYAGARYETGRLGALFARYDVFDSNVGQPGSTFRRLASGWYRDIHWSRAAAWTTRVTAEYD